MDRKEIEEKVKEILSRKLNYPKEKITLDSSLVDDLGMDSFEAIELVFEWEDNFGIEIPEEDLVEIKKVEDIVNYIINRLNTG